MTTNPFAHLFERGIHEGFPGGCHHCRSWARTDPQPDGTMPIKFLHALDCTRPVESADSMGPINVGPINDVQILWRTPGVVSASVRDAAGVHDVRWASSTGWSCTCVGGAIPCAHVLATQQTVGEK